MTPEELARLGLSRFVAIDLETTGGDPSTCRALELGAVRFVGGQPEARFSELIAIEGRVPPEITRLTGITDTDLDGAAVVEDLLAPYIEFIGGDPVLGQNVGFDLGFIRSELNQLPADRALDWEPGAILDTLDIARAFFPTWHSFALNVLVDYCEVTLDGHHRAVNDAEATGEVLLKLLAAARRTPFGELQEMHRLVGQDTALWEIIGGLASIGNGPLGPDKPERLPDNRIGKWYKDEEEESALDRLERSKTTIESFFAEDGPLSQVLEGFQPRDGQVHMANEVLDTFSEGGFLFAEGGTGTGKSFAYLLPSLLHAEREEQKVVVSTYTRHLQEQLFFKDLPSLNEAIGGGVKAVLLKGRSNYICKRRFDKVTSDPTSLTSEERISLLPLVRWLNRTRSGDISECTGFRPARGVWARISAESGFCTARVCRGQEHCFLHRVRSSVLSAHVVLVNHSLLFSDLATDGGVIGDYHCAVLDEAHHVESVAANHLGLEFHANQVRGVLGRLYDKRSETGLLVRLGNMALAWLKSPLERGDADADPVEETLEVVKEADTAATDFSRALFETLSDHTGADDGYTRRVRYRDGRETFKDVDFELQALKNALKDLEKKLKALIDEMSESELDLVDGDDLGGELNRLFGEVKTIRLALDVLTGPEKENIVFWYDLPRNPMFPVRLYGAPLNVGEVLKETLYDKARAVVLTSATMTVAGKFDYIAGRLGVPEYRGTIYDSPFDWNEQLFITVASFIGNPKHDVARFTKGVGRLAYRLSVELDAGSLVLFTSHKMLREAYDYTKSWMKQEDWMLLGQGLDGGTANLLERFKQNRQSTLFGLDSFWEGIDVPGDSLELLIVARLPFSVPTDPLVQARSEKIEREGGNPFMEYTLPEAALKLRQGIGRLIRAVDDVGVAVICDPRITTSRWGRIILDSLPVRPIEYRDYDRLFGALEGFLNESEE